MDVNVHAIVMAIAPNSIIVPRSTQVSALWLSLIFRWSNSFRVVLTVNREAAESSEESADDITAAATAAKPSRC